MSDVAEVRRAFAETLRVEANLTSPALIAALATVPREHFLGPGPWTIVGPGATGPQQTADADPARIYQNVSVAIDRTRDLYNGQPGAVASWLERLAIGPGQRVLHIGCGTGYYSAIIAQLVGSSGQVHAMDVELTLVDRARSSLAPWSWVTVNRGDGQSELPSDIDVVLVHAGSTHIVRQWLDCTRDGARIMVPLTVSMPAMSSSLSKGMILFATRAGDQWAASISSFVSIYSLVGLRDDSRNQALGHALRAGPTAIRVSRIRLDPHVPDDNCWLHSECCLSR